jgi:hypothetical protein
LQISFIIHIFAANKKYGIYMDLSPSNQIIQARINSVLPHLNELQCRIYLAAEAKSLGWGGTSKISRLSDVSRETIASGIKEIEQGTIVAKGIRRKGAGRKELAAKNPDLLNVIRDIVSPHTMGDPENPLILE